MLGPMTAASIRRRRPAAAPPRRRCRRPCRASRRAPGRARSPAAGHEHHRHAVRETHEERHLRLAGEQPVGLGDTGAAASASAPLAGAYHRQRGAVDLPGHDGFAPRHPAAAANAESVAPPPRRVVAGRARGSARRRAGAEHPAEPSRRRRASRRRSPDQTGPPASWRTRPARLEAGGDRRHVGRHRAVATSAALRTASRPAHAPRRRQFLPAARDPPFELEVQEAAQHLAEVGRRREPESIRSRPVISRRWRATRRGSCRDALRRRPSPLTAMATSSASTGSPRRS